MQSCGSRKKVVNILGGQESSLQNLKSGLKPVDGALDFRRPCRAPEIHKPFRHKKRVSPEGFAPEPLKLDAGPQPDVPLAIVARDRWVEYLIAALRACDLSHAAGAQVVVRVCRVRVIEQVHEVGLELQAQLLGDSEAFVKAQIDRIRARPYERVGGAVAIQTGRGHRERRWVQE